MTVHDATNSQYLAVVSEWESYSRSGSGKLGAAYPLFNVTNNSIVTDPQSTFPNPGYVFLLNRGEREAWDYVVLRPAENPHWRNESVREAALLSHFTPNLFATSSASRKIGILLHDPTFDLEIRQIKSPIQNVTPVFFVRDSAWRVFGPLRLSNTVKKTHGVLESIHWEPFRDDAIVFEFRLDLLEKAGIGVDSYQHPQPELNDVVRTPFTLLIGDITSVESENAFDLLPKTRLADWYSKYKKLPEKEFKELASAVNFDLGHVADIPSSIIRDRINWLAESVVKLETFEIERKRIAKQYLDTDEGRQQLDDQIHAEIKRRAANIDDKVKELRSELAREQEKLEGDVRRIRSEYDQVKLKTEEEISDLAAKRTQLLDSIETLENRLRVGVDGIAKQVNENIPLLAALTAGARTQSLSEERFEQTSAGSNDTWSNIQHCEPTKTISEWDKESEIVNMLVQQFGSSGLDFTRDFLANIYVCLKSSPLNLISGPPGHGKSSLVLHLARAIGHGNGFLEIPVRRTWTDDRYLLGFYDSFHGRYDPGQTGLATKLYQAQADWEGKKDGIIFGTFG